MNPIITRKELNLPLYEQKFKKWDSIVEEGVLTIDNPEAIVMLNDPTIYTYQFFRFENQRIKLYPYQDAIANDNHKFILFCASNQIGKSFLLDVLALYHFLTKKNVNIGIISKTLQQAKYQISRIRMMLAQSCLTGWKEERGDSESMTLLTINIKEEGRNVGVNRIICTPCTESILGYDFHYLFLDEFDFWDVNKEDFFYQMAQPRTYATKGQIIVFSNPNGQGSALWKLWNQQKWHRYNFNYLDKPGNTIEEYEALKHELSRVRFESTVAAIFSSGESNYLSPQEIDDSVDKTINPSFIADKHTYWFLDVGAKHDQCVLTGAYVEYNDDEEAHVYVFVQQEYPVGYPLNLVISNDEICPENEGWSYVKSIKEYLSEYSNNGTVEFGVDVTGNLAIVSLLQKHRIEAQDVVFSGPAKSNMYQQMKLYMEKRRLHRIYSDKCDYQLRKLVITKSQRGYLMVHHDSEEDLDDYVDSLMGCISLIDNLRNVEPSIKFIKSGIGEKDELSV